MKKLIFVYLTIIPIFSFGQQFVINGSFSSGSVKHYNKTYGFGIGYENLLKSQNKLGIYLGYSNFSKKYNDIIKPDGVEYKISTIEPNNKRIGLSLNYSFTLINNQNSKLFIGPSIGINYFFVNENTFGEYNESNYQVEKFFLNKIGAGFIMEFEMYEVFSKRINLAFSLNPEITSFEKFYSMGSNYSWFIGWLNFNLGLKYSFIKE